MRQKINQHGVAYCPKQEKVTVNKRLPTTHVTPREASKNNFRFRPKFRVKPLKMRKVFFGDSLIDDKDVNASGGVKFLGKLGHFARSEDLRP